MTLIAMLMIDASEHDPEAAGMIEWQINEGESIEDASRRFVEAASRTWPDVPRDALAPAHIGYVSGHAPENQQ